MKKIYSKAITLSIILGTLITSLTFFFNSGAFAWLAREDEATATGMQTQIIGADVSISYYYKLADDTEFKELTDFNAVFKSMVPGDRVQIRVEYDNLSEKAYTVSVAIECPDGGETPLVIDGKNYYFSTQLRIVESGDFLTTPPADKVSSETALLPNIVSLGTVALDAQGEGELEFTVEFVNYPDVDQNAYQSFGSSGSGGSCNRVITSTLN